MVNQVRFRKFDLHIREGINVDTNLFAKSPLILNVKLGSDLSYHLVNICVAWGGKYAVVIVDNNMTSSQ